MSAKIIALNNIGGAGIIKTNANNIIAFLDEMVLGGGVRRIYTKGIIPDSLVFLVQDTMEQINEYIDGAITSQAEKISVNGTYNTMSGLSVLPIDIMTNSIVTYQEYNQTINNIEYFSKLYVENGQSFLLTQTVADIDNILYPQ